MSAKKKVGFFEREALLKLYLIRHGQTEYNREGRFYGSIDTDLNPTGVEQAQQMAERMANAPLDTIYSSPLKRAQQTATPLATHHNLPVLISDNLREMDHGSWEGLKFLEARDLDVEAWDQWRRGEIPPPHGGETMDDAIRRSQAWLGEAVDAHRGKTLAVVAHGGILQALMCNLMGTPPRSLWQYRFSNTAVAEVEYHELGGVLLSFS